ncbi:hypothetical protein [Glycomyces tenuis]|uniref:hypothetical protein n=1 Tax=Glycomyces tenuis TaxID=58116 RepID=UPI000413BC76|nr:hypothetical protein [Glycomyces tenuis]
MKDTTTELTCPTERPAPGMDELHGLTANGSIAVLPPRLLEPGQALLLPFAQVVEIQSPPHAHGGIMVKTANNPAWYAFTPASWALVVLPDDASAPCAACHCSWLGGCAPGCTARIITDHDNAAALAAAGLTGDWTAAQILGARP